MLKWPTIRVIIYLCRFFPTPTTFNNEHFLTQVKFSKAIHTKISAKPWSTFWYINHNFTHLLFSIKIFWSKCFQTSFEFCSIPFMVLYVWMKICLVNSFIAKKKMLIGFCLSNCVLVTFPTCFTINQIKTLFPPSYFANNPQRYN